MIISPCISICKTDPVTCFFYGCGSKNADKKEMEEFFNCRRVEKAKSKRNSNKT